MGRRRRSPGDSLDAATSRIAIIGSGLTGLATALQLEREHGFQNVTIYERDESLSARKEGYGLTLTYHPTGVLHTLGILDDLADAECPSRSHYLLDHTGAVRGYFGSAFSSSSGYGQRGNLRVPRQRVRHILASKLQTSVICWNHKLVAMHDAVEDNDTHVPAPLVLTFDNGHVATADVVIAADGIQSSVVSLWIPTAPPPQSLGVRIILGLTDDDGHGVNETKDSVHQLLQERGFYTLAPGHRLFVMPYTGSALGRSLDANEPVRFMWQLSFACEHDDHDTHQHTGTSRNGQELLNEAMERTRDWHAPVHTLLTSTPASSVWGCLLHDRHPVAIQQHLQTVAARRSIARVIVAGDALHAMSPFKGQGANQCLRDGVVVAQWLGAAATAGTERGDPVDAASSPPANGKRIVAASLTAAVTSAMRELVQRTAPVVAASREAAHYWHSTAHDETHPFAGVDDTDVTKLVAELKQSVHAGTTPQLDNAIRSVMVQLGLTRDTHDAAATTPPDATFAKQALQAASVGATNILRRLSWDHPNWMRLVVGPLDPHADERTTCLHAAAAAGHVATAHWLVTEAGCDINVVDGEGRSVYTVSQQYPAMCQLLDRLQRSPCDSKNV